MCKKIPKKMNLQMDAEQTQNYCTPQRTDFKLMSI